MDSLSSAKVINGDDSGVEMLFSPFKVGAISLLHRVVHAPTTRLRAATIFRPTERGLLIRKRIERSSTGDASR
jgi:2,4-dienoyl-CoA reductase-like NADH-dependent reductase (Old Yellow Enzyme family)